MPPSCHGSLKMTSSAMNGSTFRSRSSLETLVVYSRSFISSNFFSSFAMNLAFWTAYSSVRLKLIVELKKCKLRHRCTNVIRRNFPNAKSAKRTCGGRKRSMKAHGERRKQAQTPPKHKAHSSKSTQPQLVYILAYCETSLHENNKSKSNVFSDRILCSVSVPSKRIDKLAIRATFRVP